MLISHLVAVVATIFMLQSRAIGWVALNRLPSTILHELAHYLVALVLGAKPSGFSLMPKKMGTNTWQLGAVHFIPGTLSSGIIALAPFWVLFPCSYWILKLREPSTDLSLEITAGLVGAIMLWGSIPSSTDLEIALKYPIGTAIVVVIGSLFIV